MSNIFWFILSFIHQYCISNYLGRFDRMLDVRMPWSVLLLISNGVLFGGCRCPSSMHAICIGQKFLAPKYMPPVSDSDAEATMLLILWHRTLTRPFFCCCRSILNGIQLLLGFMLTEVLETRRWIRPWVICRWNDNGWPHLVWYVSISPTCHILLLCLLWVFIVHMQFHLRRL